jgi:hypothetical protein
MPSSSELASHGQCLAADQVKRYGYISPIGFGFSATTHATATTSAFFEKQCNNGARTTTFIGGKAFPCACVLGHFLGS